MKNWTDDDVQELIRLYYSGATRIEMADALRREPDAVKNRIGRLGLSQKRRREAVAQRKATPHGRIQYERLSSDPRPEIDTIAERDYRAGLMPRDLTAAIFGDPLPGYSALERRS